MSLLEQSRPGDWDVFVVDSTDVRRVVERGLLAELSPQDFPLGELPDVVRLCEYHVIGGKLYAVPEKFGYNAIAYDKSKISTEEARDVTTLWDPAYKGKIATSSCYWGMPANRKAKLTTAQKKTLRWAEQPKFLSKSYPYPSPTEAFDRAMQDLWADVVQQ